jgi:hypothetical protein
VMSKQALTGINVCPAAEVCMAAQSTNVLFRMSH